MASSETKTLFYQVRSEVKQPRRGAFNRRHHVETEVPLSEHFRHDGRSSVYMDNFYASTYKREIATVAVNSNGNNQSARSSSMDTHAAPSPNGSISPQPIYQGHLSVYNPPT